MSAVIDNLGARAEPGSVRLQKHKGHSRETEFAIALARAAQKACVEAGIPATAVEVSLHRRSKHLGSGTFIDSRKTQVPTAKE